MRPSMSLQTLQNWRWIVSGVRSQAGCYDLKCVAFSAIAFCTFSHRFNSFYSEDPPAFVGAMGRSLTSAGARGRRLPLPSAAARLLYGGEDAQFQKDVQCQWDIAEGLINERVSKPTEGKDLLNVMLNGVDPVTGECAPDTPVQH